MFRRISSAVLLAAVLVVASAAAASAHVTVNPSTAKQGAFTVLAFRVPNERPDADTVKVRVQFPTGEPVPFVSVRPVPGWTATVTKAPLASPLAVEGESITEAVSEVSWTGGAIKPGEYQDFEVSVGPLPDVDEMTFKALQTYSNGEEVAWIDAEAPGGAEPDHPAPVLKLVAPAQSADTTTTVASPGPGATTTTVPATSAPAASSNAAAIVGIALGALALSIAIVALVRGGARDST